MGFYIKTAKINGEKTRKVEVSSDHQNNLKMDIPKNPRTRHAVLGSRTIDCMVLFEHAKKASACNPQKSLPGIPMNIALKNGKDFSINSRNRFLVRVMWRDVIKLNRSILNIDVFVSVPSSSNFSRTFGEDCASTLGVRYVDLSQKITKRTRSCVRNELDEKLLGGSFGVKGSSSYDAFKTAISSVRGDGKGVSMKSIPKLLRPHFNPFYIAPNCSIDEISVDENIVIIDDMWMTGATCASYMDILKGAGFKVSGALCLIG